MRRLALAFALVAALAAPARAALTEAQLAAVGLFPPPGAALPRDLALVDETGRAVTGAALRSGRPAVLVLADYTCRTLCGTALGLAAAALERTGLAAGTDYDLLVLGIDPRDGPAEALAMKAARLGASPLAARARFLSGDAAALDAAQAALGYRAALDAAADEYAHPLGAFVLTGEGAVSRVLDGLALSPEELRLALAEAAGGRVGRFVERLRLLCYGLDPARGVYNGLVKQALAAGTALTLLGLGAFVLALNRRRRA
ncbi:SCO family protein [Roseomonas nepalensis]|uniref:SCO family protein n=1 Tax=Muricoccus nepalensis TaxID=1854500 RepID=A0A502FUV5_9PROT|nr:SCO family protein [Roseomonas nepalensis]TPG53170.1 SCO family protein [Roseomonas nepalensis]